MTPLCRGVEPGEGQGLSCSPEPEVPGDEDQGLARVALTPRAPPTNPAWSSRPAHPQALPGHQRAKRGPGSGWCMQTIHTPERGQTHASGAGRVTRSQPVPHLTQGRPEPQDSRAGTPVALAQCRARGGRPHPSAPARPPHTCPGLERRHLALRPIAPAPQVQLPAPRQASAPPIAKGMEWQGRQRLGEESG